MHVCVIHTRLIHSVYTSFSPQIWDYIKANKLQSTTEKRMIVADSALQAVVGEKEFKHTSVRRTIHFSYHVKPYLFSRHDGVHTHGSSLTLSYNTVVDYVRHQQEHH